MHLDVREVELPVRLIPETPWTDEELLRFCARNELLRIERSAAGEIIVMTPSGTESGGTNSEISGQLWAWSKKDGRGRSFDSNTGYTLPDGSMLSPDASWIAKSRYAALTREQQRSFAPICPEFVIELRSPSDRLPQLQRKMELWLENGAQLAWLIDPDRRTVEVYRPGQPVEVLTDAPSVVAGAPVEGFVLDLLPIWE